MQNKALSFKNTAERTSSGIRTQQESTSSERPYARKVVDAAPTTSAIATAHTTKAKENPYAKPGVGKCYRCDG